ncbi:MAG TPA: peptide ABC transporter substrate-binding protein [Candidatus Elarobacter sp.]|nr:peptide ABC transporter substrate-binding protein [Candidatus Elarobacter sp.]
MRRAAVFALAAAVLIAGCTRIASTQSGGAGTSGATTGGARHSWTRPGILRIGSISDPDTLNPLLGTFQVDTDLSMFWAGYLFNWSDKNEFVPELATAVPTPQNGGISKDGLTITYHLRHGVQWQDGAPFDASDVVFTWQLVMNPNNNVQTRDGYDDIRSIDTPDRYTAVVHLKKPYAPFVGTFLSMAPASYPVMPKHLLAKYPNINQIPFNASPVGTGPFIVKEWHRGQTLRMVANPHYWRGAPKLKEVDYQAIPDENTLTTSISSHDIDLWYNASSTTYPTASKVADTRVYLTPFTQYAYIGFNTARPILHDLAVRKALAYATDRKRFIAIATYGVNDLAEGDQPKFLWAYDAALQPIPYDPAKAKATLDAAGWVPGADGIRVKNGTRLHIVFATTTGSALGNRVAVLMQSSLRDAGFDIEIKQYATALMFSNYQSGGILQAGKFDLDFASWLNGVDPDDSTTLTCAAIPPNGQNIYRFCDPALDADERVALTHYDHATRKKAYDDIQRRIVDKLPFLTMWFNRRFDIVSVDMKNYKPAHAVTTFWNTWEYDI